MPAIAHASRAEIITRGNDSTRTITDSAAVATLLRFMNDRPTGWGHSWHTEPSPRVDIMFYRDSVGVASFGAGPNFFQTRRPNLTTVSRRASSQDLQSYARLVGVPVEWMLGRSQ